MPTRRPVPTAPTRRPLPSALLGLAILGGLPAVQAAESGIGATAPSPSPAPSPVAGLPATVADLAGRAHLGGFIEAAAITGVFGDNNRVGNTLFGAGDHLAFIFRGQAEIQVSGTVIDGVAYGIDYEVAGNVTTGATTQRLEQCFIRWDMADDWQLTIGRFEDWLGFERNDPGTWYRTRLSPMASYFHGVPGTGLAVRWLPIEDEPLAVTLYATNGIWSESGEASTAIANKTSRDSEDLGRALQILWSEPKALTVQVDLASDPGVIYAADSAGPERSSANVWAVEFSGRYDGWKDSDGLFVAWDAAWQDLDSFSAWGAMALANLKVDERVSVTAALSYVDFNTADSATDPWANPLNALSNGRNPSTGAIGAGFGRDDEVVEYCLAVQIHPTDSPNFLINIEAAVQDFGLPNADVFWLDLQAIVIFP